MKAPGVELAQAVGIVRAAVAAEFGISLGLLGSRRCQREFTVPRHAAFLIAYELLPQASMPALARCFDRDHTAIMHGICAIQERMARSPALFAQIAQAKEIARLRLGTNTAERVNARFAQHAARELGREIGRGIGEEVARRVSAALMRTAELRPELFAEFVKYPAEEESDAAK